MPLLLSLVAFSGCTDELGGDGWVPPRPTTGGSAGSASGGEGDGGDDTPMTGGKGGSGGLGGKGGSSGGKGGRGGSGGRAGSGMTDGGEGGEPPSGAVCGNGVKEEGEECDDGNKKSFDGCPADCRASCEVCERNFCTSVRATEAGKHGWSADPPQGRSPSDLVEACDKLPGTATGGTAQGVERSILCKNMVDCIRREKCAQFVPDDLKNFSEIRNYIFYRCFLDVDITSANPSYLSQFIDAASYEDDPVTKTNKRGKCYREILEASEREKNQLNQIAGRVFQGGKPMGVANLLLHSCDKKLCREECFPELSSGSVAQISGDILSVGNDAGESQVGDLFADALRSAGGTDVGLVNVTAYTGDFNPFGLIYEATPGRPADADGRVLESEILHLVWGMDPVGDAVSSSAGWKIVTLNLTGQQLYDILSQPPTLNGRPSGGLQVSGLSYAWDATRPLATRVAEIKKGGVAIDKSASYSVTTNDVVASALAGATDVVQIDKSPAQVLIDYVKSLPQPIAPPVLDRVTRLN